MFFSNIGNFSMTMSIKKILCAVIFSAMITQYSIQAITQNQAYLGSALCATVGALLTGKSENPTIILSTCALVGVAGYFLYFGKLTPYFRHNQVRTMLNDDKVKKNILVTEYSEIKVRVNPEQLAAHLIKVVNALYKPHPDRQPFPLMTAIKHLDVAEETTNQATQLLDAAKSDIDDETEIGLSNEHALIYARLNRYKNNIEQAREDISTLPLYSEQQEKYLRWQTKQQNAETARIAAQAAQRSAQAQQDQANAAQSRTDLEWNKSWLWYLFGIKSN